MSDNWFAADNFDGVLSACTLQSKLPFWPKEGKYFFRFLVHVSDSSCGTNGVKKSSDGPAGAQSLFLNNTEHSATPAKSQVRGQISSCFLIKGLVLRDKADQFSAGSKAGNHWLLSVKVILSWRCQEQSHTHSRVENIPLWNLIFPSAFQKHENEEDGASGNKDGGGREKKETDVAISFVFGQNIKDRAKVGGFPSVHSFYTCLWKTASRQRWSKDITMQNKNRLKKQKWNLEI